MQDDFVLPDPLCTGPYRLEIISTLLQGSGTFVEVILASGDDNRATSAIAYLIANSSFLFPHCLEKWINRLQTFYKAIYNLLFHLILLLLPDISTRSTLSFHPQELLHISNLISKNN